MDDSVDDGGFVGEGNYAAAAGAVNTAVYAPPGGLLGVLWCEPQDAIMAIPQVRTTPAGDILREAAVAVDGDRNKTHGDKERSFVAIAYMWSAYLESRQAGMDSMIRPVDVAHMMVLLKQQRAEWGTPVRDQFVDAAGYSAVAGELAGTR